MLLQSIFPSLPVPVGEILAHVVAGLGAIMIAYAVFLEEERRQDLVMFLGSLCLFIYAYYIENTVFMIAMAGLAIASIVEFVEILIGLHKHSPEDLKRYKNLK